MSKRIDVLVEVANATQHVGELHTTVNRGIERAILTLSSEWRRNPLSAAFRPQFDITGVRTNPLGAVSDSAPDRWGRELMKLAERRAAKAEDRPQRTLHESDFLLGVDDYSRIGSLRFRDASGSEYLAPGSSTSIPPFLSLGKLLAASQKVFDEDPEGNYLRYLLKPGTSVGGARPKAVVRKPGGGLLIAKFPKVSEDLIDVPAWEQVALNLSRASGARTAASEVRLVAGRRVILLERFDRNGEERIPYLSAMSMMGAADGETRSYLEIGDLIRQHGNPEDQVELLRRMVNSVLMSNTDDHMRNHGFLFANGTWHLSPAFDMNPVPAASGERFLASALTVEDTEATLENCLQAADYLGVRRDTTQGIISRSATAISGWVTEATKLGIPPSQIDAMETAFEHKEMVRARKNATTLSLQGQVTHLLPGQDSN